MVLSLALNLLLLALVAYNSVVLNDAAEALRWMRETHCGDVK